MKKDSIFGKIFGFVNRSPHSRHCIVLEEGIVML